LLPSGKARTPGGLTIAGRIVEIEIGISVVT
jgi:hypothetical protein